MSNEIKPHVETTLDDYKAYAFHIREDAQSRGVENTRLSIYGIYMAVVEKQAAELERYETARQEDARRLEMVKGERDAMREKYNDTIFRCDKAVESVKGLFGNPGNPDELRLRGKIEGIRLAEAYFETALNELLKDSK